MNSAGEVSIGVDVGGTNIVAGAVLGAEVIRRCKVRTPTDGGVDALVAAVHEAVRAVDDGTTVSVGIGLPGQISPDGTTLETATNLAGIDPPVEVRDLLARRLRLPVTIDNDVNIAALGEWQFGAAQGYDDVLVITVGTGVGGALVLDGRLRRGPHGLAGEIGHLMARPDGRRCGCGQDGHLEAYAGRAGMERAAREAHAEGVTTELVEPDRLGPIRSKQWLKAARSKDPVALDLIDDAALALGTAIGSVASVVDLSMVAVGGGLGDRLGEPFVEQISLHARRAVFGTSTLQVVPFALGDDAALVGAAALARMASLP